MIWVLSHFCTDSEVICNLPPFQLLAGYGDYNIHPTFTTTENIVHMVKLSILN